jgi:hypothetical protein
MVIKRVSYISTGLTKISQSILVEIADKKATHLTFHGNQIGNLEIKPHTAHDNRNNDIELEHLVDLDLSSNSLHSGCVLITNFIVGKSISLLGCCRSLLKLNLSANGFTSKSFEAFVSSMPTLPHLTTLDISHNSISKLPSSLKQQCLSLRSLTALSNQIKSLSSLLHWLHQFRGQLEYLTLSNQKGSSNPVCSATLYKEKVIFVLGDRLLQLDSRNVSEDEKRQVHVRLSMYASSSGGSVDKDLSLDQERKKKKEKNTPPHTHYFPSDDTTNDENNANSSDIEHRVEFLSNLIEKQAQITSGLLEVTQNRNDNEIEMCDLDNDEHDDISCNDALELEIQIDNAATISHLRSTAACALVRLALVKEKQRQSLLRMSFSQWILAARFSRHLQLLKSKFTKSEAKWRERANDLVAKAVKQEQEMGIAALKKEVERNKVAEEKVSHLNERIKELEVNIQFEQTKSATFAHNATSESDRLRTDLQEAHAKMKQIDEERKNESKLAAVEIESIRGELHHTQEELKKEKGNNTRLELMYNEVTKATQEARNTATAHSAELHDLKMELVRKENTIKQLKAAYEQTATRAASDRSKCEHALAGERQKGEIVKTCTKKMRSLESDKQNLMTIRADLEAAVSKKESQLASMQQALHEKSSTINNLKATIEEKDCKIDSFDRRLKYVSDERDDFQQQFAECKRIRAQLQSQLDRAKDEVQEFKRCSSEAHRLETMKLQQNLDALRQSSQLTEQELSANMKMLQRECQDKVAKQAKLIKSLGHKLKACETRESDLERSHRSELQELRHCREQEMLTLKATLADESESTCLFIEVFTLHK